MQALLAPPGWPLSAVLGDVLQEDPLVLGGEPAGGTAEARLGEGGSGGGGGGGEPSPLGRARPACRSLLWLGPPGDPPARDAPGATVLLGGAVVQSAGSLKPQDRRISGTLQTDSGSS